MNFCFRAGACQVEVGLSCFAVLAFISLFLPGSTLAFLCAVALHEAGHLLAMTLCGTVPGRVVISAMGMRMVLPGAGLGGGRGAMVSLAGPGTNLLCFLICWAMGMQAASFALASLSLALLHLLPIEPLDGGLALRYVAGPRVSRWIGAILLLPLAAMGFLVLLQSRYNYTLLGMALYLMGYLLRGDDWA